MRTTGGARLLLLVVILMIPAQLLTATAVGDAFNARCR